MMVAVVMDEMEMLREFPKVPKKKQKQPKSI
jgi:hypothetical protein